jgi:hypothetical protein
MGHGRREFLAAGAAALGGAAPSLAESAGPRRVFDAHLHCPAESGELWQWHTVTPGFREFVAYLERAGVQRGIINSQRAQAEGGTPAEFIAGNREVARYVEKSKGRFVGACVVNPQFVDEALKEVEYCRKQLGFVWVGELCNYMIPYDYTIREFELLVREVVRASPRRRSSFPISATAGSIRTSSSGSTSSLTTPTATSTPRATGMTGWACWSMR